MLLCSVVVFRKTQGTLCNYWIVLVGIVILRDQRLIHKLHPFFVMVVGRKILRVLSGIFLHSRGPYQKLVGKRGPVKLLVKIGT